MPKAKPYSGPVDENVARQLLNSTGHSVELNGVNLLLGDALLAAAKQLRELVTEANSQLEDNEFAKIVAEHQANEMNRRGGADIAVADDGTVLLHINYKGNPRNPKQKSKRKRKLPLMEELKARAAELGVEIPSEFGIKRSKIVQWLDEYEAGGVPKDPPKKAKPKVKPKPKSKAKIEVAEDPPEADPGPMSAGADETKVSAPLDETKPPKKRGFVKTSPAISGPVVVGVEAVDDAPTSSEKSAKPAADGAGKPKGRLRQLAEASKDVDISDLLSSDPPK
jgi:hypothetical protein